MYTKELHEQPIKPSYIFYFNEKYCKNQLTSICQVYAIKPSSFMCTPCFSCWREEEKRENVLKRAENVDEKNENVIFAIMRLVRG